MHRPIKRNHIDCCDDQLILSNIDSTTKKTRRSTDYQEHHYYQEESRSCKRSLCDWPPTHRKKIKTTSEKRVSDDDKEQQYHCHAYLRLFPSTLKCSIDVIVRPVTEEKSDELFDDGSILIGRSRIAKSIPTGVVRVRLVSSLFTADPDVSEDPSLCKFEKIRNQAGSNYFDKQYALTFKKDHIGPGVIGKLFVELLDPSTGSYTNSSAVFEVNLNLSRKHEILSSSSDQKITPTDAGSLQSCGCFLSEDASRVTIGDRCNVTLNDTKLLNRISDVVRCQWKSIGRDLFPCFSEVDLTDLQQTYLLTDGNRECAYQLLREWSIRDPKQANVRNLLTRMQLSFDQIVFIHDQIRKNLSSN